MLALVERADAATRLTPTQLKLKARRIAASLDALKAKERAADARRERRVRLQPLPDAQAGMWMIGPAEHVAHSYSVLDALARALPTDDPRTLEQRRFDLLYGIITGRDGGSIPTSTTGDTSTPGTGSGDTGASARAGLDPALLAAVLAAADLPDEDPRVGATSAALAVAYPVPADADRPPPLAAPVAVGVLIDAQTLLHHAERPGELIGYGPIPAELARALAGQPGAAWRRFVYDPVDGHLLDYGRRTYRPPKRLREFVLARDGVLTNPFAPNPQRDFDHVLPWSAGGATSAGNGHAPTRTDHNLKTHAGYRVDLEPDGTVVWTTPAGHVYRRSPHDYRPEPGPDPGARHEPRPDTEPDPPPF